MESLQELLELVANGKHDEADAVFADLMSQRVAEVLADAEAEMARTLFGSTEGEDLDESTESLDEGNKENKAKKNAVVQKLGKDTEKYSELAKREHSSSERTPKSRARAAFNFSQKSDPIRHRSGGFSADKLIGILKQKKPNLPESVEQLDELSNATLDSYKSKASEDLGGAKAKKRLKGIVRADMQKRKAKKAEALGSAKKEMDGWKPDKKDVRKIYQKAD